MFSRSDGATALQADLVRALSFSAEQIELEGPEGREPALAGLAGIWNGDKGSVAVLVRRMHSRVVERYLYAHPIISDAELRAAVEEGIAFLEDLGFAMDLPEHVTLSAEARERRLRLWNKLRKIRSERRPAAPRRTGRPAERAGGEPTERVVPPAREPEAAEAGGESGSTATLPDTGRGQEPDLAQAEATGREPDTGPGSGSGRANGSSGGAGSGRDAGVDFAADAGRDAGVELDTGAERELGFEPDPAAEPQTGSALAAGVEPGVAGDAPQAASLPGDIDPDEAVTPHTPADLAMRMVLASEEAAAGETEALGSAVASARAERARAVLGRIELIRRRGGGRIGTLARLLSFF
jgi:hypothetical protein